MSKMLKMKKTYVNELLQPELEAAFKSQDPELLDIVFDIEGKKIYANKIILSINSSTFKSMLSDRWTSKNNDVIKIESYKFDEFKELLTFIYSRECNITNENIFAILDMAAFYQIEDLKELSDEYLSKMELNLSNVLQLIEISNKYSLIQMKGPVQTFLFQNFPNLAKFDGFLNANKSMIKEIVAMESNFSKYHEKLFQTVYEWSKYQAIKKQQLSNEESFNIKDAIKTEMEELLPNIQFKKMNVTFLKDYVAKREFLFTADELANILKNSNLDARVKITNSNGQAIFGDISGKQKYEIEIIKSLNGRESDNERSYLLHWVTYSLRPSSPLKKRTGIQWYLFYFENSYNEINVIGVGNHRDIEPDCDLIAELFAETDFEITPKCKIEIE
uniref:BTB domain-containing protein n=1 Tax=Panagrolaimus davidi TaxID=227884 RepID=A0A914QKK6_9BILA